MKKFIVFLMAFAFTACTAYAATSGPISASGPSDWEDESEFEFTEQKEPGMLGQFMGSIFERMKPENLTQVDEEKQRRAEQALGFSR